jgi:hypothetical protein
MIDYQTTAAITITEIHVQAKTPEINRFVSRNGRK